jgi:hypothetical protein
MKRTLTAFAVSLILAACSSSSGELEVGFPVADANRDAALAPPEFDRWIIDTNAYARFDDNDDGVIDRREYDKAVEDKYETDDYFNAFDLNDDGTLSRGEFVGGLFRMYDVNRDGLLSEEEFDFARPSSPDFVASSALLFRPRPPSRADRLPHPGARPGTPSSVS